MWPKEDFAKYFVQPLSACNIFIISQGREVGSVSKVVKLMHSGTP